MSYDASAARRATGSIQNNPLARPAGRDGQPSVPESSNGRTSIAPTAPAWPEHANGSPDFARMTSLQRQAYDQARLTRRFG